MPDTYIEHTPASVSVVSGEGSDRERTRDGGKGGGNVDAGLRH